VTSGANANSGFSTISTGTTSFAARRWAGRETIETRSSWTVCVTALAIAAVSYGAPVVPVVALKQVAADLGGERSIPALAYSLTWLGAAVGGLVMGRVAERLGIRFTVIFGAVMIAIGLVIAQSGGRVALLVGYGGSPGCSAMPGSTRRSTFMCRAGSTAGAARRWRCSAAVRRCRRRSGRRSSRSRCPQLAGDTRCWPLPWSSSC
jgi:MFS family permease